MKKLTKAGLLVTTAALSLGLFSPVSNAQSIMDAQQERIAIEVESTETAISKEVLIQKLKALFPKKFDFLSTNDFNMSNGHYYPEDERVRYELSYHKTLQGKDLYGSIQFVGDNLEIEYFYFEPLNTKDALFPAKISKEEAEKLAVSFLQKIPNGKEYKLDPNSIGYSYYSDQLITEPIRYEFTFVKKKNNIPIADQQVQLSVLGNGEIVSFYRYAQETKGATFDDTNKVKNKDDSLQQIKENLEVSLKYQVIYDYRTGKESIALVYNPTIQYGVNAITGEWKTANGFTEKTPTEPTIEKISSQPLPARQANMTVEDVRKMAEELLKIESDKVKLSIMSIDEIEDYNGQEVFSVHYSYDWEFGGHGASLEINKKTGEIVSYYNIRPDVLRESGEWSNPKGNLTEQQALTKATDYLKEWVPSYLHNYAKPIDGASIEQSQGIYNFSFPRIVNGIVVEGHQIFVSVRTDGTLNSLTVNHQENVEWPSIKNVISKDEAKNKLIDALSIELQYMTQQLNPEYHSKDKHYHLVYTPVFNDELFSYFDASTGEWNSLFGTKVMPTVTHPTAEAELNYLIQNRMLEVKDPSSFNADIAITNGEALKLLVKSLSYFYEFDLAREEESNHQEIMTIEPDNPYYSIVDRAVKMGILNYDDAFNPEEKLTREQLAVWYVRALGLETAAKYNDIYKLSFDDAANIQKEYVGYVALANALQIINVENNQFKPKGEVAYAEIAVTVFKLAHAIHESGTPYIHY